MKKTITTITLAILMTLGATFANAGILVSDRSNTGIIVGGSPMKECEMSETEGIIVGGFGEFLEMLGIIVSDSPKATCEVKEEADSNGIIVGG